MASRKTITIEDADRQIARWQNIREILTHISEQPNDSVEVRIIKKYLRLGSVSDVSDEINAEGYRVSNSTTGKERKYTTNDISSVIRSSATTTDADKEMCTLARELFNDHKKFIDRIFN